VGTAIAVIALLLAAAVTILVTADRRRATTGTPAREMVTRDASTDLVPAVRADDIEAGGRARARQARAAHAPTTRRATVLAELGLDEETIGVSRRQFLNRSVVTAVGFSTTAFGTSVLAFLWPTASGVIGGKVTAGKADEILASIAEKREPFYVPIAKTYIVPYPTGALPAAKKAYKPSIYRGMEQGLTAMSQRCVHLGCRVPWCGTSQWFECPCHGSKYNRVGEWKGGPAPRGLDRWPVSIEDGDVVIDTAGAPVQGPPVGTNTTKQQQEGPSCI